MFSNQRVKSTSLGFKDLPYDTWGVVLEYLNPTEKGAQKENQLTALCLMCKQMNDFINSSEFVWKSWLRNGFTPLYEYCEKMKILPKHKKRLFKNLVGIKGRNSTVEPFVPGGKTLKELKDPLKVILCTYEVILSVSPYSSDMGSFFGDLSNDKDFFLFVVKTKACFLRYASKDLQNDKEVVMAAVKQEGWALQYASDRLQSLI